MNAEECLREGDLDGCLRELQKQVRKDPSKAANRVFLFQLLAVTGAWDRALTQLNVVGELDAAALPMVQTYREALQCEALREAVFKGERAPLIFGEPTGWLALLLEALRLDTAGDSGAAAAARARALDEAPATAGALNGEPFRWLADADNRLGPTLEAVLNGRYYWIPFSRIKRIEIEPPSDLRDRVWMPAVFTWANDGQAAGLIPARYPGTLAEPNRALWLARLTEWIGDDPVLARPVGQRMFASDANDYALFDVRTIELTSGDAPAEQDGAAVPDHG
ncbi:MULTISPECIES: type VI secretion system accessory protein TagJ [unclassified Paraburkholderia]|uniref:type VI secretion system accessory protein TagJ n=1 Tax=unclassified Paraburkholderia TaxID=2615204 RepID=UPI001619CA31|nr:MULTISPECIES: type VI secretion system accessory protein TagJ [unclassified Paraburkholderia]MBB5447178.1 type VI secretion system protein ImpE [Paraburkholderia sp. WSM4177]MBB5487717.1 type VI secretion system protein ImpE [Paraburkholderia sp. WSM4180]